MDKTITLKLNVNEANAIKHALGKRIALRQNTIDICKDLGDIENVKKLAGDLKTERLLYYRIKSKLDLIYEEDNSVG